MERCYSLIRCLQRRQCSTDADRWADANDNKLVWCLPLSRLCVCVGRGYLGWRRVAQMPEMNVDSIEESNVKLDSTNMICWMCYSRQNLVGKKDRQYIKKRQCQKAEREGNEKVVILMETSELHLKMQHHWIFCKECSRQFTTSN